MSFYDGLRRARALRVFKISRAENVMPLARALEAGGLEVLAVTLRPTPLSNRIVSNNLPSSNLRSQAETCAVV